RKQAKSFLFLVIV
ncbi:arylesterase domain protein, partial [Vibrio parahaemolyticus V-223/04]